MAKRKILTKVAIEEESLKGDDEEKMSTLFIYLLRHLRAYSLPLVR